MHFAGGNFEVGKSDRRCVFDELKSNVLQIGSTGAYKVTKRHGVGVKVH